MLYAIFIALFLTIIIELFVAAVLGVIKDKTSLLVIIFANLCTNPLVVCIGNLLSISAGETSLTFFCGLLVLEISAFYIEFLIYKHSLNLYPKTFIAKGEVSPLMLSFICNFTSFFAGVIIGLIT